MRELGSLVWRTTRETGEAAAEAIEHRATMQRLALQVRKLDKERSGLIRQIGSKVYALHGQNKVRNQDVLGDCVRIDAILAEITALQKEMERLRQASLEQGIEVPIMSDETPLTDEEEAEAPVPAATGVPSAVHSAGTVGQQSVPPEGPPRASIGREEYDETGSRLTECTEGPSKPGKTTETCEAEEITQHGTTPQARAEEPPNVAPSTG
jgi:hypothetical protein